VQRRRHQRDGYDLPTLTVEATRAQASLKSPQQMWLPNARSRSVRRCCLAWSRRGVGEQQLTELVEKAVPARFAETGRGEPSPAVLEQVSHELQSITGSDLADLLLFAHDVGRFCSERGIPLAELGQSELCPLDHGLDGHMFCHEGRDDLPDLDLEVSSLHEAAVSAFVQHGGTLNAQSPLREDNLFPTLRSVRVGVHVSMGARQAVRSVGAALGMEASRVNTVARQVPLLSSPDAIDNIMTHAPELGIADAGAACTDPGGSSRRCATSRRQAGMVRRR
jgi:hypothetical protein